MQNETFCKENRQIKHQTYIPHKTNFFLMLFRLVIFPILLLITIFIVVILFTYPISNLLFNH